MNDLVRILGPGSYTRIAKSAGRSRQHIGRVLRGDARGSEIVLGEISAATGVPIQEIESYISQGGSPSAAGLPALRIHHQSIPMISCPHSENGSRWDGLRELVVGLGTNSEEPTKDSAIRVVMTDKNEASRAAQCLHAGKRSRSNLLREVEFTTSVDGNILSVWRKK